MKSFIFLFFVILTTTFLPVRSMAALEDGTSSSVSGTDGTLLTEDELLLQDSDAEMQTMDKQDDMDLSLEPASLEGEGPAEVLPEGDAVIPETLPAEEAAAVEPASKAEVLPAPAATMLPSLEYEGDLLTIRNLSDEGKYLEARRLCEKLLLKTGLPDEVEGEIVQTYEKVNWQLLFSKEESPESVTYTIQPGDNLYNLAKKYKTTVALIKKVNGLQSDTIYPDMKLKIITQPFEIKIDKSDNYLKLGIAGKPLKRYRVATGTDNGTPAGTFKIVNKLENPTWYYAGAVVPPDSPENILGTRWFGFDAKGYGIHGTTLPDSIGKQETLGCIRMFNAEVEELYDMVSVGASVTVVD